MLRNSLKKIESLAGTHLSASCKHQAGCKKFPRNYFTHHPVASPVELHHPGHFPFLSFIINPDRCLSFTRGSLRPDARKACRHLENKIRLLGLHFPNHVFVVTKALLASSKPWRSRKAARVL